MNYTFPSRLRITTFILMFIGVAAAIYGFIQHPDRAWANLLLNGFFFTAISLAGAFFIAATYVAEAGWHVGFKRVPEAMSQYLPFGAVVILVVILSGVFGFNHIYHWMDHHFQETDQVWKNSGKKDYLNTTFYLARTFIYLIGWTYFAWKLRQISKREDREPNAKWHKKSYNTSALFLVFFAVTSSMSAWDWLMSIDVHWYSTLFGWYVFAGFFVSALVLMLLITIGLKRRGYLPLVNENHIHDLAKMVFAFSVFWTYLWFSQYMLIWYSNIGEEINYFLERFNTDYFYIMVSILVLNFAFPLLILMHRNAKRNYLLVNIVGVIIFFGHYLDMFQIIMPGSIKEAWNIGFTELGMFAGFIGAFLFVVHTSLTKASLVPANHQFLNESKQHHI